VPVVKSEYSNPATPLQPAKPIAIPEIPVTMPVLTLISFFVEDYQCSDFWC
jgi:hypothetical protein